MLSDQLELEGSSPFLLLCPADPSGATSWVGPVTSTPRGLTVPALGAGGKPHPPGGFCQSQISPVDDLGGWVLDGTAIANGAGDLFLGNPSSCQKG